MPIEEAEREEEGAFDFLHRGEFPWNEKKKETVEIEAADEESEDSLDINADNDNW